MTLAEIDNAKTACGKPHRVDNIYQHAGVPILLEGIIIDENRDLDVYWMGKTGLCYIGNDEIEQFNLVPKKA